MVAKIEKVGHKGMIVLLRFHRYCFKDTKTNQIIFEITDNDQEKILLEGGLEDKEIGILSLL